MLYMPMSIIFQSCLGAFAASYILFSMDSIWGILALTLSVSLCIIYNAAILAQLSVRWVFKLLVASVVLNALLLLLYW